MCYPERTQHIFLHNAPELPVGPSTHQADGQVDCSGAEDVTLRACGPTERGGTTMQKTVSSGPFADVLSAAQAFLNRRSVAGRGKPGRGLQRLTRSFGSRDLHILVSR